MSKLKPNRKHEFNPLQNLDSKCSNCGCGAEHEDHTQNDGLYEEILQIIRLHTNVFKKDGDIAHTVTLGKGGEVALKHLIQSPSNPQAVPKPSLVEAIEMVREACFNHLNNKTTPVKIGKPTHEGIIHNKIADLYLLLGHFGKQLAEEFDPLNE